MPRYDRDRFFSRSVRSGSSTRASTNRSRPSSSVWRNASIGQNNPISLSSSRSSWSRTRSIRSRRSGGGPTWPPNGFQGYSKRNTVSYSKVVR